MPFFGKSQPHWERRRRRRSRDISPFPAERYGRDGGALPAALRHVSQACASAARTNVKDGVGITFSTVNPAFVSDTLAKSVLRTCPCEPSLEFLLCKVAARDEEQTTVWVCFFRYTCELLDSFGIFVRR